MVPAMITPLGLTRTIEVPGELARDSVTRAVPVICWQYTPGATTAEIAASPNTRAMIIRRSVLSCLLFSFHSQQMAAPDDASFSIALRRKGISSLSAPRDHAGTT